MTTPTRFAFGWIIVPLLLVSPAQGQSARAIVKQAGFRGGVAVHVGCGDGRLAAELHRLVPNSLVCGLGRDDAQLQRCRASEAPSDGKVIFLPWDGRLIPVVDQFVNLLIISERQQVASEEIERVLAPGGTAVLLDGKQLQTIVKPRPDDIDQWTHYLYDVDNNPVSKDQRVRPPLYHLQWVGSPRWSRHHDVMSSFSACVSADNKVFYIFDEGLTFSPFLPTHWKLIARDAFNGTVLWKREIPKWFPNLHPLKSGPATLPRRLVAVGKHVYVTLGIEAPVSELDSDTGRTLRVFDRTEGTEEILCSGGSLYLVVDRNPQKEELSRYPVVPVNSWPRREKHLVRVDLESGEVVWDLAFPWVAPLSLALDDERAFFYDGQRVRALARADGQPVWQSEPLPLRKNPRFGFAPSLMVYRGVVVYTGGENTEGRYGSREQMYGLSAKTGEKLWEAYHPASGYRSPEDLFGIQGLIWCGDVTDHRWLGERGATGIFYGADVESGQTKVKFGPDVDAYWFHHRCHMARATENFLITSRTGIEMIDWRNRSWHLHHWVRGACLYGVMPANGMIYAPQHPCPCYIAAKLFGFNALKPRNPDHVVLQPTPENKRLVRGPAYGQPAAAAAGSEAAQWPTYRHDNRRSGASPEPVAASLRRRWSVRLPAAATPPVVADGKVLVSLRDRQVLYALDARSGRTLYQYYPAGRIDSPPSVAGRRVYFGCTDGAVYCIRLDDGALLWRYQAAPTPVHHMYFEHLESTHPVHGTVLVRDGRVYAVSGRSMFVDGGMRLVVLDADTGQKIVEHVMDDKVPGTDEPLQMHHEFLNMPVALPDILSCNDEKIFMRFQQFDLDGKRLEIDFPRRLYGKDIEDKNRSFESLEDQKGKDAHVFSATGFLDDSWWHRTYWIYGKHFGGGWPGYYLAGRTTPAGRVLCFDEQGIFGWGRLKKYFRWSKPYEYMLFATDYDYQQRWARSVPILVRAMVKAGGQLHILGPREVVRQEQAFRTITSPETQRLLAEQEAALQGRQPALLLSVDAADGTVRSGYQLPATPVFDGLVAAGGRLYISLVDGTVACLGQEGKPLEQLPQAAIAEINAHAQLPADAAGRRRGQRRKAAKPKSS